MAEFNEEILQILIEGITLKELLHPNFVTKIKEEFEEESVDPIKINFIVETKNDIPRSITLLHKNSKQKLDKKLVIDVDNSEDLPKILKAIKEVK